MNNRPLYRKSRDGIERRNVHVIVRLTQEQYAAIADYARRKGKGVNDVLSTEAGLAVEILLHDIERGQA